MKIKEKIMEYFREYWGKRVFVKSVSMLVAICFVINIANLPAYAAKSDDELLNKRTDITDKQEGAVNPNAARPVNEQVGINDIKAELDEGALRDLDKKEMAITQVGAIVEKSRDGKSEKIVGSIDGNGNVQIFSGDSSRPYSKQATEDYTYRAQQVLQSGAKRGQYVETHSKEYVERTGEKEGVKENKEEEKVVVDEEGIKGEKAEEAVQESKQEVVQKKQINEESVETKQNALKAMIKDKETASVTKATIAKVMESAKEAGVNLTAKFEEEGDREDAKIEVYQSRYNGENIFVGKKDGQMAYPTHNGSVEIREEKDKINIGGNEFEATGIVLVKEYVGKKEDGNVNKRTEGLFFSELIGIFDSNLSDKNIEKAEKALNKEGAKKSVKEELKKDKKKEEGIKKDKKEDGLKDSKEYKSVVKSLMKDTGASKEEVEASLEGITEDQLKVLNDFYKQEGATIVNCATDALGNILEGTGLTKGLLALQALSIDIAKGNLSEDSVKDGQLHTSMTAINEVLKANGIESAAYGTDLETFKDGLKEGESAIVWVDENHYITVTKEKDGNFSVQDPNKNNGEKITFDEENFDKLMRGEEATDSEGNKQSGYNVDVNDMKVVTASEGMKEKAAEGKVRELSEAETNEITGAKYVTKTVTVAVEKTRMETRTGTRQVSSSYTDSNGVTHTETYTEEYTYEVEVSYIDYEEREEQVWVDDEPEEDASAQEQAAIEERNRAEREAEEARRAAELARLEAEVARKNLENEAQAAREAEAAVDRGEIETRVVSEERAEEVETANAQRVEEMERAVVEKTIEAQAATQEALTKSEEAAAIAEENFANGIGKKEGLEGIAAGVMGMSDVIMSKQFAQQEKENLEKTTQDFINLTESQELQGVEQGALNQAISFLNNVIQNGGDIINCAADALTNVTGVSNALMAMQALSIDIASGAFFNNNDVNNKNASQVQVSMDAMKGVLEQSGDYKGHLIGGVEGLEDGMKNGDVILNVNIQDKNGKDTGHYITIITGENGDVTIRDVNKEDKVITKEEIDKAKIDGKNAVGDYLKSTYNWDGGAMLAQGTIQNGTEMTSAQMQETSGSGLLSRIKNSIKKAEAKDKKKTTIASKVVAAATKAVAPVAKAVTTAVTQKKDNGGSGSKPSTNNKPSNNNNNNNNNNTNNNAHATSNSAANKPAATSNTNKQNPVQNVWNNFKTQANNVFNNIKDRATVVVNTVSNNIAQRSLERRQNQAVQAAEYGTAEQQRKANDELRRAQERATAASERLAASQERLSERFRENGNSVAAKSMNDKANDVRSTTQTNIAAGEVSVAQASERRAQREYETALNGGNEQEIEKARENYVERSVEAGRVADENIAAMEEAGNTSGAERIRNQALEGVNYGGKGTTVEERKRNDARVNAAEMRSENTNKALVRAGESDDEDIDEAVNRAIADAKAVEEEMRATGNEDSIEDYNSRVKEAIGHNGESGKSLPEYMEEKGEEYRSAREVRQQERAYEQARESYNDARDAAKKAAESGTASEREAAEELLSEEEEKFIAAGEEYAQSLDNYKAATDVTGNEEKWKETEKGTKDKLKEGDSNEDSSVSDRIRESTQVYVAQGRVDISEAASRSAEQRYADALNRPGATQEEIAEAMEEHVAAAAAEGKAKDELAEAYESAGNSEKAASVREDALTGKEYGGSGETLEDIYRNDAMVKDAKAKSDKSLQDLQNAVDSEDDDIIAAAEQAAADADAVVNAMKETDNDDKIQDFSENIFNALGSKDETDNSLGDKIRNFGTQVDAERTLGKHQEAEAVAYEALQEADEELQAAIASGNREEIENATRKRSEAMEKYLDAAEEVGKSIDANNAAREATGNQTSEESTAKREAHDTSVSENIQQSTQSINDALTEKLEDIDTEMQDARANGGVTDNLRERYNDVVDMVVNVGAALWDSIKDVASRFVHAVADVADALKNTIANSGLLGKGIVVNNGSVVAYSTISSNEEMNRRVVILKKGVDETSLKQAMIDGDFNIAQQYGVEIVFNENGEMEVPEALISMGDEETPLIYNPATNTMFDIYGNVVGVAEYNVETDSYDVDLTNAGEKSGKDWSRIINDEFKKLTENADSTLPRPVDSNGQPVTVQLGRGDIPNGEGDGAVYAGFARVGTTYWDPATERYYRVDMFDGSDGSAYLDLIKDACLDIPNHMTVITVDGQEYLFDGNVSRVYKRNEGSKNESLGLVDFDFASGEYAFSDPKIAEEINRVHLRGEGVSEVAMKDKGAPPSITDCGQDENGDKRYFDSSTGKVYVGGECVGYGMYDKDSGGYVVKDEKGNIIDGLSQELETAYQDGKIRITKPQLVQAKQAASAANAASARNGYGVTIDLSTVNPSTIRFGYGGFVYAGVECTYIYDNKEGVMPISGVFTGLINASGKVKSAYIDVFDPSNARIEGVGLSDDFGKPAGNNLAPQTGVEAPENFAQTIATIIEEDGKCVLTNIERIGIEDDKVKKIGDGDVLAAGSKIKGREVVDGYAMVSNDDFVSVEETEEGKWERGGTATVRHDITLKEGYTITLDYMYGAQGFMAVVDYNVDSCEQNIDYRTINFVRLGEVHIINGKIVAAGDNPALVQQLDNLETFREMMRAVDGDSSAIPKLGIQGQEMTLNQYREFLGSVLAVNNTGTGFNIDLGALKNPDTWINITYDNGQFNIGGLECGYTYTEDGKIYANRGTFTGNLNDGMFSGTIRMYQDQDTKVAVDPDKPQEPGASVDGANDNSNLQSIADIDYSEDGGTIYTQIQQLAIVNNNARNATDNDIFLSGSRYNGMTLSGNGMLSGGDFIPMIQQEDGSYTVGGACSLMEKVEGDRGTILTVTHNYNEEGFVNSDFSMPENTQAGETFDLTASRLPEFRGLPPSVKFSFEWDGENLVSTGAFSGLNRNPNLSETLTFDNFRMQISANGGPSTIVVNGTMNYTASTSNYSANITYNFDNFTYEGAKHTSGTGSVHSEKTTIFDNGESITEISDLAIEVGLRETHYDIKLYDANGNDTGKIDINNEVLDEAQVASIYNTYALLGSEGIEKITKENITFTDVGRKKIAEVNGVSMSQVSRSISLAPGVLITDMGSLFVAMSSGIKIPAESLEVSEVEDAIKLDEDTVINSTTGVIYTVNRNDDGVILSYTVSGVATADGSVYMVENGLIGTAPNTAMGDLLKAADISTENYLSLQTTQGAKTYQDVEAMNTQIMTLQASGMSEAEVLIQTALVAASYTGTGVNVVSWAAGGAVRFTQAINNVVKSGEAGFTDAINALRGQLQFRGDGMLGDDSDEATTSAILEGILYDSLVNKINVFNPFNLSDFAISIVNKSYDMSYEWTEANLPVMADLLAAGKLVVITGDRPEGMENSLLRADSAEAVRMLANGNILDVLGDGTLKSAKFDPDTRSFYFDKIHSTDELDLDESKGDIADGQDYRIAIRGNGSIVAIGIDNTELITLNGNIKPNGNDDITIAGGMTNLSFTISGDTITLKDLDFVNNNGNRLIFNKGSPGEKGGEGAGGGLPKVNTKGYIEETDDSYVISGENSIVSMRGGEWVVLGEGTVAWEGSTLVVGGVRINTKDASFVYTGGGWKATDTNFAGDRVENGAKWHANVDDLTRALKGKGVDVENIDVLLTAWATGDIPEDHMAMATEMLGGLNATNAAETYGPTLPVELAINTTTQYETYGVTLDPNTQLVLRNNGEEGDGNDKGLYAGQDITDATATFGPGWALIDGDNRVDSFAVSFSEGDKISAAIGLSNIRRGDANPPQVVNTSATNWINTTYEAGALVLDVVDGKFYTSQEIRGVNSSTATDKFKANELIFGGDVFKVEKGAEVSISTGEITVVHGTAKTKEMGISSPVSSDYSDGNSSSDSKQERPNSTFEGDVIPSDPEDFSSPLLVTGTFYNYSDEKRAEVFSSASIYNIGSKLNRGSFVPGMGIIDGQIEGVDVDGNLQWKGVNGRVTGTSTVVSGSDKIEKTVTISDVFNEETKSYAVKDGTKYTVNGQKVDSNTVINDGGIEILTLNKDIKDTKTGEIYPSPDKVYFVNFETGTLKAKLTSDSDVYWIGSNRYSITAYMGETPALQDAKQLTIFNSDDNTYRGLCGSVRTMGETFETMSNIVLEGNPCALVSVTDGKTDNPDRIESTAEFGDPQEGYVFVTESGMTFSIKDYKEGGSTSFLQNVSAIGSNYDYGVMQKDGTVAYTHMVNGTPATLNYAQVGENGTWESGVKMGVEPKEYWFSYNGKDYNTYKDAYAVKINEETGALTINKDYNEGDFVNGKLKDNFMDRGEFQLQVDTFNGQPIYLTYRAGGAILGGSGFKSAKDSGQNGFASSLFGENGKSPFTFMNGENEEDYNGQIFFEFDEKGNLTAVSEKSIELSLTEAQVAVQYYQQLRNNMYTDESIQMHEYVSRSEYEKMLANAPTEEARKAIEARFGYETNYESVMYYTTTQELGITFGPEGYSDDVIVLWRDQAEVIDQITEYMQEGIGNAYWYWDANNTKSLEVTDLRVNAANFTDANGQTFEGSYQLNSMTLKDGVLSISANLEFNTGNGSIVLGGSTSKPLAPEGDTVSSNNNASSGEESRELYRLGVDFASSANGETNVTLKTYGKEAVVEVAFDIDTNKADGTALDFSLTGSASVPLGSESSPGSSPKLTGFMAGTMLYAIQNTTLVSSEDQRFTNSGIDEVVHTQYSVSIEKDIEIFLSSNTQLTDLSAAIAKAIEKGDVKTEGVDVNRVMSDSSGNKIIETIASTDKSNNSTPKWQTQYVGNSKINIPTQTFAGGIYNANKNRVEFGFWDGHINMGQTDLKLDKNFFARAAQFVGGVTMFLVADTDAMAKTAVSLVLDKQVKYVTGKDVISVAVGVAVAVVAVVTTVLTAGSAASFWGTLAAATFTAFSAGMSAYQATMCFMEGDIKGGILNSIFAIVSIAGGGALARSFTTIGAGIGKGLAGVGAKLLGREAAKEAAKALSREAFKAALKETAKVALTRGLIGAGIGSIGNIVLEGIRNGWDFSNTNMFQVVGMGILKGFMIGASSAGFGFGMNKAGLMQLISFTGNAILINRSLEMAAYNFSKGNIGAGIMDSVMALTYTVMPIINKARASASQGAAEKPETDRSVVQDMKTEQLNAYKAVKEQGLGATINWHIENGVNVGLALTSLNVMQTVANNIMSGNSLFENLSINNIITMYSGGIIGGSLLSMAAPAFTKLWTTGNITETLKTVTNNPLQTLAGSLGSAVNMTRFKAFFSPLYEAVGNIMSAGFSSVWEGITTGNWDSKIFSNPSAFFGGIVNDFKDSYVNTLFRDFNSMSTQEIQESWGQVRSSFGSAVFVSPLYQMATPGQAMFNEGSMLNNLTSSWAESGSLFRMIAGNGKIGRIFDSMPGLSNALNIFQFELIGKAFGGLGKGADALFGLNADYISADGSAVGFFEFMMSNASMLFVPSKMNQRAVSNYIQRGIESQDQRIIGMLFEDPGKFGLSSQEIGSLQMKTLRTFMPNITDMKNIAGLQRVLDRGTVGILGKNYTLQRDSALYALLLNHFKDSIVASLNTNIKQVTDKEGNITVQNPVIKVGDREMSLTDIFRTIQDKSGFGVALFRSLDKHFATDLVQAGILTDAVKNLNSLYKGEKFLTTLNTLETVKERDKIEKLGTAVNDAFKGINDSWKAMNDTEKAKYKSFNVYLLSQIKGQADTDVRTGLVHKLNLADKELINVLSSDGMKQMVSSYDKMNAKYLKEVATNSLRDNATTKFKEFMDPLKKGDLGEFTIKGTDIKVGMDFQMIAALKFNLAHASIYGYGADGIAGNSGIMGVYKTFFGENQKVYSGGNIGNTSSAFDANGKLKNSVTPQQLEALFKSSLDVIVGSNIAGNGENSGWGFSGNQLKAINGIFNNVLMRAYNDKSSITDEAAHSMLKSINILGTGEGKTAIVAALFPVTKLVNDIKGERTVICADIDTNVMGLMGRIQGMFGANYELEKVTKDNIGSVSKTAALFMTYTDLGFIVVADKQNGGKDAILLNKMGVILGDEADMAVYLSKVMISSSGGFEKADSPMAKFFDSFATQGTKEANALKSAVNEVQKLLMKDPTYKKMYEQLKRFEDKKTTADDIKDIKKELSNLEGKINDKDVQQTIKNIISGLGDNGQNAVGKSAEMLNLLQTALSINLNERTKLLLSDEHYQTKFKGSYENILKELTNTVHTINNSYGIKDLNGTGFGLQEVLGNMLMAKLTWSQGVDYGIGKTDDGQNKVMLIKSGALIDLVPGVGFKQIIEAEMIKNGANLGGITAIGDRNHSSIAIIDALKNARGFVGLTGTYSASAQSAMGFDAKYYTDPTSLKLTGTESVIDKGGKNVIARIFDPAQTVFGAFEKPILTMLDKDSTLIMGMPTQAKIDLFKGYAQLLGVISREDAGGRGSIAWFDAGMSKDDGQIFAKNKQGQYQHFIGTNEQLGRGVDIQARPGIQNIELVIVDPHLSYKSAVEQLAGRVLGTRFSDQAQNVIPGTNNLKNINISIVSDMSTINTYAAKHESALGLGGSVSAEQYLGLLNARVYGNDRSGREAEDRIVAQSGAVVLANSVNTYRPYVNTASDLSSALSNIGVERSLIPSVMTSMQNRNYHNGAEMRDNGSVAAGYALQLLGYDSKGQSIPSANVETNIKTVGKILGKEINISGMTPAQQFDIALDTVKELQDKELLADNMTNNYSLNEIFGMSRLIDAGAVKVKDGKKTVTASDIEADTLTRAFNEYHTGGLASVMPNSIPMAKAARNLAQRIQNFNTLRTEAIEMEESGEALGITRVLQGLKVKSAEKAVERARKNVDGTKQDMLSSYNAADDTEKTVMLLLLASQTDGQGKVLVGGTEKEDQIASVLSNRDFADNINWNDVSVNNWDKALESGDFTSVMLNYNGNDKVIKDVVASYKSRVMTQRKEAEAKEKEIEDKFLKKYKVAKVSDLDDTQKQEMNIEKAMSMMPSGKVVMSMEDIAKALGTDASDADIKKVLLTINPVMKEEKADNIVSYYNDVKEVKGDKAAGSIGVYNITDIALKNYNVFAEMIGKEDAMKIDFMDFGTKSIDEIISSMKYADFGEMTKAKQKALLNAVGYKGYEVDNALDMMKGWANSKEFIAGLSVQTLADTQFMKGLVSLVKDKTIKPSELMLMKDIATGINAIAAQDISTDDKVLDVWEFYEDTKKDDAVKKYVSELKGKKVTSYNTYEATIPKDFRVAVASELGLNYNEILANYEIIKDLPGVDAGVLSLESLANEELILELIDMERENSDVQVVSESEGEPGNVVPFVSDRYTPADIIDHYGMPALLKTVSGIVGDKDISEGSILAALQNCAVDSLTAMGKLTEINALGKFLAKVILMQRAESRPAEMELDYMLAAGVGENAQPVMLKDVREEGNLEYAVTDRIEEVKMSEEGVIGILNKEGAETLHLINIRGVTDGTVSYMEEGTMKYASLKELELLGFNGLIMTDRATKRANKEALRSLNASDEKVAEILNIDTTNKEFMTSNEYNGARKLANAIVNGVMEGEESSKAVMYVLNIWQNMGAMAERLNISEADIESADGVNLIAQGYLKAVGEVLNAAEAGVLSPGEVMTEVKLLSTVRDMLIAVNKDNSGELKTLLNKAQLAESDISKIKSRLVVSKAVNMNAMVRGLEEAKNTKSVSVAGEDYEFDIAKLKSSVEEKKSIKERFKGKFFSSSAKLEDVLPTLGSDTFIANRGTIVSPMMARALAAAA